jgi:hypothetical protein
VSFYEHDTPLNGAAPVGKGTISVDGTKVLFKGHYFMATTRGREAFELVKALGPDSEWSIGYGNVKTGDLTDEWKAKGARRIIASMDVKEVSPVFIGANGSTGTISVKAAGSLTDRLEVVNAALWSRNEMASGDGWYAIEVFEDHVIVSTGYRAGAKMLKVPYTMADGAITLGDAVEVEIQYVPVESKAADADVEDKSGGEGAADEPAIETPVVDEAEVKRLAEEVETKAREDAARLERAQAARDEYDRIQRTLKRLRVA